MTGTDCLEDDASFCLEMALTLTESYASQLSLVSIESAKSIAEVASFSVIRSLLVIAADQEVSPHSITELVQECRLLVAATEPWHFNIRGNQYHFNRPKWLGGTGNESVEFSPNASVEVKLMTWSVPDVLWKPGVIVNHRRYTSSQLDPKVFPQLSFYHDHCCHVMCG